MAIFSTIGAWVTIGLGNLGLSLSAAMAVGGAVTNIAIGAALLGAQALIGGAFGPKPSTSTPQAQATLNQSAGARIRGYGRAKLGGTRAFWESKDGQLVQAIMVHSGGIDAFEEWWIGDRMVALDGAGSVVTEPFAGWVRFEWFYGTDTQAASATLTTAFPSVWTSAHQLKGIAYFIAEFASPSPDVYQQIFPQGSNTQLRTVARLSPVYDPRTGLTAWSDNPALCILDYLTHPDGYRRALDDIDIPSFIEFANLCDQAVPLASGGTERRYRLWGIYSLTDDPQDVLNKMRSACDAEFYQTAEGKIAIRGGKWEPPTVTIRDSDILAHSMEQGNNRFSAFNDLKVLFTSPSHDYQTTEATAWEDLEDQADRGVLTSDLHLDMVPSATQARRLAKIHIAKSNPRWKGTIVANLSALNALGERTVRVVLPELGIDDAFFVAGFSIKPDLTGVEISVMSISEESYTWTTAEEGESPPPPQDTRPDLTLPVPDILSLEQDDRDDGPYVEVTVAEPGRTGLTLQAQVRIGAGSIWQPMNNADNDLDAEFGPTVAGLHQVRVRWVGPLSTAGNWSDLEDIEVT